MSSTLNILKRFLSEKLSVEDFWKSQKMSFKMLRHVEINFGQVSFNIWMREHKSLKNSL
jgi:hypothetical protein